ncbi:TRAP transporter TatT component family protein [Chondromyces crocatus]|uniref:TRAP transporter TatT component family protein n=1 Tax=Chondromyces crocatus TaxID=52 RepID=UPI00147061AF|nr:TRAP transporter TatT component family protein [Chondromyces crocatus]
MFTTTVLLSLGSAGCIKQALMDGQIEATRKGAAAIDTLGDYEVARTIAFNGLGQFEGMRYLAPENEDALFMLTKNWGGATYGFIEDELEQAEDADGSESEAYAYQQSRARGGYDRAIFYGIKLLERRHPGFEAARKNDDTIRAWLQGFDDAERDVEALFWTGYAWLSKINVAKEDPALVGELFIGAAIMERAVQLDETYMHGSGHVALGAYHARNAMAELDEAKKHFDRALEINGGKHLFTQLNYATKYYCMKGDQQNYEKLLKEVIAANDPLPAQRLQNTIAKRRAKRFMKKSRLDACGF